MDVVSCRLKRRQPIQLVISEQQFKSLHLWRYGIALVSMVWTAGHLERLHRCWREHRSFLATSAPIQTMFVSNPLYKGRVQVLNWSACSPDLSPRKKTPGTSLHEKSSTKGPGLFSSYNPASDRSGTTFISSNSRNWSHHFPEVYRQLLKEEGMLHNDKVKMR